MINRILMELYDNYTNDNVESLIEFSKKTFPTDGTTDLFIGCCLIMFSRAHGYEARYDCTREELLEIVYAVKEKIGKSSLLEFYVERLNTYKGINKYFKNNLNIDKCADLIIEYLEQFKPRFRNEVKKHKDKLDNYVN